MEFQRRKSHRSSSRFQEQKEPFEQDEQYEQDQDEQNAIAVTTQRERELQAKIRLQSLIMKELAASSSSSSSTNPAKESTGIKESIVDHHEHRRASDCGCSSTRFGNTTNNTKINMIQKREKMVRFESKLDPPEPIRPNHTSTTRRSFLRRRSTTDAHPIAQNYISTSRITQTERMIAAEPPGKKSIHNQYRTDKISGPKASHRMALRRKSSLGNQIVPVVGSSSNCSNRTDNKSCYY